MSFPVFISPAQHEEETATIHHETSRSHKGDDGQEAARQHPGYAARLIA